MILPVYLPALLLSAGSGALGTFLPLYLTQMGMSVAVAALLVGIGSAGILVFDLPSGFLLARYGERRVMFVSGAGMALGPLVVALSRGPAVATVGLVLANASASFWLLGRLEFLRKALPNQVRGRGLSLVGGMLRIGMAAGPLVGGVAAHAAGYPVVFLGTAVLAGVSLALFLVGSPRRYDGAQEGVRTLPIWDTQALVQVVRARKRVLVTAGLSMLVLAMARSGRGVVIPLWGQAIDLDPASIGLVAGVSNIADTLMFYPAGMLSDRKGRKWSAVACLLGLSVGLAMIPLTHGLVPFLLVALVIGLGNGLGSGINMTLGADFASGVEPGVFLGAWRLVTDAGAALAPVVIGLITGALALGPAVVVIAALGVAGGLYHAAAVPETLQRPGR